MGLLLLARPVGGLVDPKLKGAGISPGLNGFAAGLGGGLAGGIGRLKAS